MNEELESVETQEVAETVETVETEQPVEIVESEETVEVAEQPKQRDYERDADFANLRRAKEEAERKAIEREKEIKRLKESMKLFFNADDTNDLADQAQAHYTGKSVEEVRAERLKEEELELTKAQLKAYEEEKAITMYENDLKEVQALNPKIKSLGELGQKFIDLRLGAKLSATEAYKAITAINPKVEPPKEIGKINTTGIEKEYFTKAQLESFTDEDFAKMDKKTFEKVEKSYFRLR